MADNVYNLKFTLSNGDVIDAGQITAPQGPKGDKGDSATIDANTLNGLLSGSNGISIAKNAAGDKVEVKLDDNIKLGSTQIPTPGRTASLEIVTFPTGGRPYYIRLNNNGIQFQSGNTDLLSLTASAIQLIDIGGGGISKEFLHQGNVKTLFGNQSIYGSGNIDLYRHILWIKNDTIDHQIYITVHVISSSNTPIDSLTDLFSVLNSYRNTWYPCNGRVNLSGDYKGVAYNFQPVSGGVVVFFGTDGNEHYYNWSEHQSGLTVEDTVTTV